MDIVRQEHVINAYQWNKVVTHSQEGSEVYEKGVGVGWRFKGLIVKYYHHPNVEGSTVCPICDDTMDQHGWIDQGTQGVVVCPNDYLVQLSGSDIFYVYSPEEFATLYRVVEDKLPLIPHTFQERVHGWLHYAFHELFPDIINCKVERNHRFLEESLELVQSLGLTESEAHELVDYVFSRPIGEPFQEVGGVSTTLSALCTTNGIDLNLAAETELDRDYKVVDKIRYKQGLKPPHRKDSSE